MVLYRLPFLVYAVMSSEELLHKIQMVSVPDWAVSCIDISYTSRCEVFVAPRSERVSCKTLEALSDATITVDCYGRYE